MHLADSRNVTRVGLVSAPVPAPSPADAEFFQAVIDDHRRRPRHRGPLPAANRVARRENPLCGDRCEIQFRLASDSNALTNRILAAGFTGAGCALSQASASLLTVAATGRTAGELRGLAAVVDAWVRTGRAPGLPIGGAEHATLSVSGAGTDPRTDPGVRGELFVWGDLAALAAAHAYPARHACALLAWQAALAALEEPSEPRASAPPA